MNKTKHIAIIPARKGSVGLPKKNQILFKNTVNFLKNLMWIDEVIVSSDDLIVLEKASRQNYICYNRPKILSGPNISIKKVLEDLCEYFEIDKNTIVWLFYLPIVYKEYSDFEKAKKVIEKSKIRSLCSFIPAKTHPFNTWKYDKKKNKLYQYIKNDIYRRQDLPSAWMHHHYICCFKIKELKNLNSELLNSNTYPIFLSRETSEKLIEIDTPKDFEKWKEINSIKKFKNEKK